MKAQLCLAQTPVPPGVDEVVIHAAGGQRLHRGLEQGESVQRHVPPRRGGLGHGAGTVAGEVARARIFLRQGEPEAVRQAGRREPDPALLRIGFGEPPDRPHVRMVLAAFGQPEERLAPATLELDVGLSQRVHLPERDCGPRALRPPPEALGQAAGLGTGGRPVHGDVQRDDRQRDSEVAHAGHGTEDRHDGEDDPEQGATRHLCLGCRGVPARPGVRTALDTSE